MEKYPVYICYGNIGFYLIIVNMILSFTINVKNHKLHFYCLDQMLYEKLFIIIEKLGNKNIILEKYYKNVSSSNCSYGTTEYNRITHNKVDILIQSLYKYDFIHFIDSDVVFINEPPLDYYSKYENYDMVFQYETEVFDSNKETMHNLWSCTGNFSLRNNIRTINLLNKMKEYQKYSNLVCNDQECLFVILKEKNIKDITEYDEARLYTYPYREFTNGAYVKNNVGNLDRTFILHVNHVIGYESKINLLKKANKWYLD